MMFGIDYLGGARYPDVILREHPAGWAAGFFINVDGFGPSWDIVRQLLATGRCPRVRLQAYWHDQHIFKPSDTEIILDRVERTNKLKQAFPNVDIQFSPMCEHSIKGAALKALFDKVRAKARGLTLVNSPAKGDFLFERDIINEVHGTKKPPQKGVFNYSFDGTGCVDADVENFKKTYGKADTFFWWTYQNNLLLNNNDPTPRAKRKAEPTSPLLDSMIYLRNPCGIVKLPPNYLWKSHADQHKSPKPEDRAGKPVCIIPSKVARVELVCDNGQVLAASSKPGPFADGRWRYYFSDYGYNLAEKAKRIQNGNPVVSLRVGGKIVGTLNPAFRAGDFRT